MVAVPGRTAALPLIECQLTQYFILAYVSAKSDISFILSPILALLKRPGQRLLALALAPFSEVYFLGY